MEFLTLVRDIDNALCLLLLNAVTECSHISRVITEATIRFLDHQRDLLFRNKDTCGTIALNRNSTSFELVNDWLEHWVVERLTNLLQTNVETIVDLLEFKSRELAEHFPRLDAVLIARLKFDNIGVSQGLELFILIEALLGILIKCLKVCNVGSAVEEVGEGKIELTDKHTELSTPVSGVIDSQHVVALEFEKAADAITLDSGAQVTHVHILSDVWR